MWTSVLGGDQRDQWDGSLLGADGDVTQYWDRDGEISRYFSEQAGATYDVFAAYGDAARWGDDPRASGAPVIDRTAELERALAIPAG